MTSYYYNHVGIPASWGQVLLSVGITFLIYVVIFLSPSKKITGKDNVISHNNFQTSSN